MYVVLFIYDKIKQVINLKNIICERRIYESCFNTHSHLYGQLILPIKGKLYIETEHKKLQVDNNNAFFLPPESMHTFKAEESNDFLTLDINKDILNADDIKNLGDGKEIQFDDKWKAIRYLLLSECRDNNNSDSINALFNYCYHLIIDKTASVSIEFINQHFYENIDIKTLADMEHYSVTYYSEWFKRSMGVTVTEYIRNLRIKKAKELLENTDLSVLAIAQIIGYEYNSSFTRSFKECENISPAQFRKNSVYRLKRY